jgi:hypothetical protein
MAASGIGASSVDGAPTTGAGLPSAPRDGARISRAFERPCSTSENAGLISARSGGGGHHDDRHDAVRYLIEGEAQSLALLREAVRSLKEEIEFSVPQIVAAAACRFCSAVCTGRSGLDWGGRFAMRISPGEYDEGHYHTSIGIQLPSSV